MNAILRFFAPLLMTEAVASPVDQIGAIATYYADSYEGQRMANGKPFRQAGLTCATNYWPLGARLRVVYEDRTVDVTVTDRMHLRFRSRIDLSKKAFLALSPLPVGTLVVGVTRLP